MSFIQFFIETVINEIKCQTVRNVQSSCMFYPEAPLSQGPVFWVFLSVDRCQMSVLMPLKTKSWYFAFQNPRVASLSLGVWCWTAFCPTSTTGWKCCLPTGCCQVWLEEGWAPSLTWNVLLHHMPKPGTESCRESRKPPDSDAKSTSSYRGERGWISALSLRFTQLFRPLIHLILSLRKTSPYSKSPNSVYLEGEGQSFCFQTQGSLGFTWPLLPLQLDWGLSPMKIPQGLVYSLLQIRANSSQTWVIWNSLGVQWSNILFCDGLMLGIWRNIWTEEFPSTQIIK